MRYNGSQPYVTFGCFPKNNKATKLRKGAVSGRKKHGLLTIKTKTKMTKEQATEKGFSIESYANGFIIADYSGNRGEASYCGKSMGWRKQPIVQKEDVFETEEEALSACDKA